MRLNQAIINEETTQLESQKRLFELEKRDFEKAKKTMLQQMVLVIFARISPDTSAGLGTTQPWARVVTALQVRTSPALRLAFRRGRPDS